MIRKDVKLGFAIGGVLLAVLVVYMLVGTGGKPTNGQGANLITEERVGRSQEPANAGSSATLAASSAKKDAAEGGTSGTTAATDSKQTSAPVGARLPENST